MRRRSILSYILLVGVIVPATFCISSCLVVSQRAAREASVLADMKAILDAEKVLFSREQRHGTLDELDSKGIIDAGLIKGHNRAYRLEVRVNGSAYEVLATPIHYGRESTMSFFADCSGLIRCSDKGGAEAEASDGLCD